MKNRFPRRGASSYYAQLRKWTDEVEGELARTKKQVDALEKRLEKLEKPAPTPTAPQSPTPAV